MSRPKRSCEAPSRYRDGATPYNKGTTKEKRQSDSSRKRAKGATGAEGGAAAAAAAPPSFRTQMAQLGLPHLPEEAAELLLTDDDCAVDDVWKTLFDTGIAAVVFWHTLPHEKRDVVLTEEHFATVPGDDAARKRLKRICLRLLERGAKKPLATHEGVRNCAQGDGGPLTFRQKELEAGTGQHALQNMQKFMDHVVGGAANVEWGPRVHSAVEEDAMDVGEEEGAGAADDDGDGSDDDDDDECFEEDTVEEGDPPTTILTRSVRWSRQGDKETDTTMQCLHERCLLGHRFSRGSFEIQEVHGGSTPEYALYFLCGNDRNRIVRKEYNHRLDKRAAIDWSELQRSADAAWHAKRVKVGEYDNTLQRWISVHRPEKGRDSLMTKAAARALLFQHPGMGMQQLPNGMYALHERTVVTITDKHGRKRSIKQHVRLTKAAIVERLGQCWRLECVKETRQHAIVKSVASALAVEKHTEKEFYGLKHHAAMMQTPFFTPDRVLVQECGSESVARCKFQPSHEELFEQHWQPVRVTAKDALTPASVSDDLKAIRELFMAFPFREERDFDTYFALLCTPMLRPLFADNYVLPVAVIASDADGGQGAGKSYLARAASWICYGADMDVQPGIPNNVQWEQKLASLLKNGFENVLFDNVDPGRVLGDQALESALTAPNVSFRTMRSLDTTTYRQDLALWFTGNGVRLSRDMLRRALFVRLKPRDDDDDGGGGADPPLDLIQRLEREHFAFQSRLARIIQTFLLRQKQVEDEKEANGGVWTPCQEGEADPTEPGGGFPSFDTWYKVAGALNRWLGLHDPVLRDGDLEEFVFAPAAATSKNSDVDREKTVVALHELVGDLPSPIHCSDIAKRWEELSAGHDKAAHASVWIDWMNKHSKSTRYSLGGPLGTRGPGLGNALKGLCGADGGFVARLSETRCVKATFQCAKEGVGHHKGKGLRFEVIESVAEAGAAALAPS